MCRTLFNHPFVEEENHSKTTCCTGRPLLYGGLPRITLRTTTRTGRVVLAEAHVPASRRLDGGNGGAYGASEDQATDAFHVVLGSGACLGMILIRMCFEATGVP